MPRPQKIVRFAMLDGDSSILDAVQLSYDIWIGGRPSAVEYKTHFNVFQRADRFLESNNEYAYDCVCLDLNLAQGENGFAVFDKLTQDGSNAGMVIAIVSNDMPERLKTQSTLNKSDTSEPMKFSKIFDLYELFKDDICKNRVQLSIRKHEYNAFNER